MEEALKQEQERADSFRLSVEELKRSCEQQAAKEESQAQALRAVEVGFECFSFSESGRRSVGKSASGSKSYAKRWNPTGIRCPPVFWCSKRLSTGSGADAARRADGQSAAAGHAGALAESFCRGREVREPREGD